MLVTESNRKWWLAAAVGIGSGLVLLDESIVGVVLPVIARDLSVSLTQSHWVVTAYLLTFAGFAAAGGRFGDLFGVRRVFLAGLALLAGASVFAGLANDFVTLVVARAAQGLSAAIVFATGLALVTMAFPKAERGAAIGVLATTATVMFSLGPFIGGVVSVVSWRLIFFINLPIALLAAMSVLWLSKPVAARKAAPVDFIGLLLLFGGLVLIVLVLMEGADWGWTRPVVPVLLTIGIALLGAFIAVESRLRAPLIDVRLLAIPAISGGALMYFTAQLAKMVVVIFVPLYLHQQFGFSPIYSGAFMLAAVIGSPLLGLHAGRTSDRLGAGNIALLGLLFLMIGTFAIAGAVMLNNETLLAGTLLIWGFALPYSMIPAVHAIIQAAPAEHQGEATGIIDTFRVLGGVFGMAGASALYAETTQYAIVFLATAVFMVPVFIIGFASMKEGGRLTRRSRHGEG